MNILTDLAYECWIQVARLFNLKRRNALFVVLLGRPGSGKGTIATRLSERHNIPHLSTGNLVRRELQNDQSFAAEWGPQMKGGKLLPDWLIFRLLHQELGKPEFDRGAVLDGFPRTAEQARMLRRMLAWRGNKVDVAIYLDVDTQDLVERLAGRRTCTNPECARTYHVTFSPSKVEGVCDACGSPTKQRDDEKPEAIAVRFEEFDRTFAPLHNYYDDSKLLVTIRSNNKQSFDQAFQEVLFAVDEVD